VPIYRFVTLVWLIYLVGCAMPPAPPAKPGRPVVKLTVFSTTPCVACDRLKQELATCKLPCGLEWKTRKDADDYRALGVWNVKQYPTLLLWQQRGNEWVPLEAKEGFMTAPELLAWIDQGGK